MGSRWPVSSAANEIQQFNKFMTRTKTQKMRAKKARAAQAPPPQQPRKKGKSKNKKWFLGFDNFRMGSGDAPKRSRNMDLISMAPAEMGVQQASSNRRQIIAQDELVAMVQGSVTLQCTSWQVQPGLVANFPWLAQIANLYQKYKIRSMVFYFKPTVSQYNALGQQGRVVLSFDTDALSPLLQSTQQAEAMTPHVDGLPYEKMFLELPSERATPGDGKFVRSGPAPAGSDIKTYDAGVVYFTTEGLGGSGQIGELRVKYVVELLNPVLPNTIPPQVNYRVSAFSASSPASLTTGVQTQIAINTVGTVGNGLGVGYTAGGSFTMPSGLFNLTFKVKFTPSANNITTCIYEIRINGGAVGWSSFRNESATMGINTYVLPVTRAFSAGDVVTCWAQANFPSGTATADGYLQIELV